MDASELVCSASTYPEQSFVWMLAVAKSTYDQLADIAHDSGGVDFSTLDAKLATALTKIASGSFARDLRAKRYTALEQERRITGRQILELIDDYFRVSAVDGALCQLTRLFAVNMRNNDIERFLNDWDMVLLGMNTVPDKPVLENLFLKQVANHPLLTDYLSDYERKLPGDSGLGYDAIYEMTRRLLA